MSTAWHTAKAVGRYKLTTEWIVIDLQSEVLVAEFVLDWDKHYPRYYQILISSDDFNWVTIYVDGAADGGRDYVEVTPITTRYIKIESFAWNNSPRRIWLNEISVYGQGGP